MTTAILYTSETCSPCKRVKDFLDTNNIPYETKTVDEAIKAGFRSVPILQMFGLTSIGYNNEELNTLKKLYKETINAN